MLPCTRSLLRRDHLDPQRWFEALPALANPVAMCQGLRPTRTMCCTVTVFLVLHYTQISSNVRIKALARIDLASACVEKRKTPPEPAMTTFRTPQKV